MTTGEGSDDLSELCKMGEISLYLWLSASVRFHLVHPHNEIARRQVYTLQRDACNLCVFTSGS